MRSNVDEKSHRMQDFSQLPPLPQTPRREATTTLQGYAYQVWVSLDQWLRLPADSVLFLEGAEDIDRLEAGDADTIQVRHTRGTISLNTKYAREAIAQFWVTREREQKTNGRQVRYTYLTTSDIALESNASFGGRHGIATWENARYETSSAETLRAYLILNMGATGSLLSFLRNAKVEELQQQLFLNFSWVTNCPDVETVQGAVTDRLSTRLNANNYSRTTLEQIRDNLFTYCWKKICKPRVEDRLLTAPELERQIQAATTIYLPLPMNAMGSLLIAAAHMSSLQGAVHDLSVLAQEIPIPPEPLLNRPQLTGLVATHLRLREPVLLTGSVFKGKTTIAILAALATVPNAWWIDLSDRPNGSVRDIFAFLAMVMERSETPELIVLDDLNTSETAKKTYGKALSKLVYNAKGAGKTLLLTAQGSPDALEKHDATGWGIVVLDIPSMSDAEIRAECTAAGCSSEADVALWGELISIQTTGHPKLVQVRIAELHDLGWPAFDPAYFFRTSAAVRDARQMAQALFSESVSGAEAEYVYTIAEFHISPSREMLLNLADLSPNVVGPDSLIRKLTGKWLETVTTKHYRVTPILRAVAGETWSDVKHQAVHRTVFDSIAKCSRLNAREGAALLFHGVVARDAGRTTDACLRLITIKDAEIKEQAHRALSWIVPIGIKGNTSIFPWDKATALLMRGLQFQVGAAQHAEELDLIVRQWKWEIADADEKSRSGAEMLLNFSILTTPAHLSPATVLEGAVWVHTEGQSGNPGVQMFEDFHTEHAILDLPKTATSFQTYLVIKFNMVTGYEDFCELVDWIGRENCSELLNEFDAMMTWPTVTLNGLFLHMGWIAESKLENANWERWIVVLSKAWTIAKAKNLHSFGCEVARALSVILCEQVSDLAKSLAVLDHAVNDFGPAVALAEQRSNAFFQMKQDAAALEAWDALIRQFGSSACVDPNAFRRTALAAVNLERWPEAATLFEDGANTLSFNYQLPTLCALLAEAALAWHLGGNQVSASSSMSKCFDGIPKSPEIEGSVHWEAALRMFGAIASQIRGHRAMMTDGAEVIIKPGMASNPLLTISSTDENHKMRMAILEVEVLLGKIASTGAVIASDERLVKLLAHEDPIVRWLACLNSIAFELTTQSTSFFVSLVETSTFALEHIRKNSPYANGENNPAARTAGLYLLAAICDPRPIDDLLSLWEPPTTTTSFGTSKSVLSALRKGSSLAPMAAADLVFNNDANGLVRCGAALSIIKSALYDARSTAAAQTFLTMMVQNTGAASAMKGQQIESIIGQRYAENWKLLAARPQLFSSPSRTIPPLREAIELSLQRKGSVKRLLQCGAAAGGIEIGQIIDTVDF